MTSRSVLFDFFELDSFGPFIFSFANTDFLKMLDLLLLLSCFSIAFSQPLLPINSTTCLRTVIEYQTTEVCNFTNEIPNASIMFSFGLYAAESTFVGISVIYNSLNPIAFVAGVSNSSQTLELSIPTCSDYIYNNVHYDLGDKVGLWQVIIQNLRSEEVVSNIKISSQSGFLSSPETEYRTVKTRETYLTFSLPKVNGTDVEFSTLFMIEVPHGDTEGLVDIIGLAWDTDNSCNMFNLNGAPVNVNHYFPVNGWDTLSIAFDLGNQKTGEVNIGIIGDGYDRLLSFSYYATPIPNSPKDGWESWEIALIVIGSLIPIAICVGIFIWYQKQSEYTDI